MGWKDRAKPVQPASGNGWRARARPVAAASGAEYLSPGVAALDFATGRSPEGQAVARGFVQGGTLGFGDELAGALTSAIAKVSPDAARWMNTSIGEDVDPAAPVDYAGARDMYRGVNAKTREASPKAFLGGEVIGSVALPGGPAKSLGRAALQGAGFGAAYGVGGSDETDLARLIRDAGIGGLAGGVLGGVAHGVAKLPGAVRDLAGRKAAAADEAISSLAAKEGSAPTASARSAAGRDAQNAYRQLENLRDTGRLAELRGPEEDIARKLTAELADSAEANLAPAAAKKAESASVLRDVAQAEPQRVAEAAERIGDPMNQIKPLLKRYALPIGAGAYGALTGDDSMDRLARFGVFGLAGRGIGPTALAVLRRARHPSVQRSAMGLLESVAGGAARSPEALVPEASRAARPHVTDVLFAADGDPLSEWFAELRRKSDEKRAGGPP